MAPYKNCVKHNDLCLIILSSISYKPCIDKGRKEYNGQFDTDEYKALETQKRWMQLEAAEARLLLSYLE